MSPTSTSISVIVPVFNTEEFIEEALDSLINQEIPFHEIIVIDDGSTDGSTAILRRYEAAGKIKLLVQKNQGQGAARNAGLNLATGDFVYFFDSDDRVTPNLTKVVSEEIAKDSHLDIIVFSGETFYEAGVETGDFTHYKRPFREKFNSFFLAATKLELSRANFPMPCLYTFKRATALKAGLSFPGFYHEDEAFLLQLMYHLGPSLVIPQTLYERRVRAGSTMTMKKNQRHVDGYLSSSAIAKELSKKSGSRLQQQYFNKWAIQHYLNAIAVSYYMNPPRPFRNLFQKLAQLPSYKLNLRQVAELFGGEAFQRFKANVISKRLKSE